MIYRENARGVQMFSKISGFIRKETNKDNESNKMIILIRVLSLFMLVFFIVNIAYCAATGITPAVIFNVASFIAILGLFALSYVMSKTAISWLFIFTTVIWGIVSIGLFGWDSGIQSFLVITIILIFFADYGHYRVKSAISALAYLIYLVLYLKCDDMPSYCVLTATQEDVIRMLYMAALIVSVSVVAFVFGKDSQHLENKLIEYNRKLEEKANTDSLTGLFNRGKAMDYLGSLVAKANEENFSLCICDIDFFKKVNDNYGHDAGDEVLKEVAKVLLAQTKGIGFVARWGGEEFLIAFPNMNGDLASEKLFEIQRAIHKMEVHAAAATIKITMTYGLTEYDNNIGLDQSLKDADNKLYLGKERGRDVVIF